MESAPARRRRGRPIGACSGSTGGAAQPGGDRRAGGDGVADAADGPAVPGGRVRAAPVPRPAGLGAGARPCAGGRCARRRDGRPQRLLREGRADPAWLAGLEDGMARHAVAVTAARMGLVERLERRRGRRLSPVRVGLECPIAERLRTRRRSRWRTGCARRWQRRGRRMPPPGRRLWARTAPTWRWPTRGASGGAGQHGRAEGAAGRGGAGACRAGGAGARLRAAAAAG